MCSIYRTIVLYTEIIDRKAGFVNGNRDFVRYFEQYFVILNIGQVVANVNYINQTRSDTKICLKNRHQVRLNEHFR